MTISVLIPAYRAGQFLAQTLQSALAQTYDDIRIHVHIDPCDEDGSGAAEDSLQAIESFRSDPRIHVRHNPERLGWAANTRSLLHEVETPYYAILPHDDFWEPDYLQVLHAELESFPDASVAYCDLITFNDDVPWRKSVRLPRDGSLREQLLAFLLEGAEAMPWRGVTRSALLPRIGGFPVDEHGGFAVECEYALSLLLAGTAIHVPRTLYHKRVFPIGASNASQQRIAEAEPAELRLAWATHASRMEELLRDGLSREHAASDSSDALLLAALTAAMLRRYQQSISPVLTAEQRRPTLDYLRAVSISREDGAEAVRSRLQLALSRHADAIGDDAQGYAQAKLAISFDPDYHEARLYLAHRLQACGLFEEAMDCVSLVERDAPEMAGLAPLLRHIRNQMD